MLKGSCLRSLTALLSVCLLASLAVAQALTPAEVAKDAEKLLNSQVSVKGIVSNKTAIDDKIKLDSGLKTEVELTESDNTSPLKIWSNLSIDAVPAKGDVAEFTGILKRDGTQLVIESAGSGMNWKLYGLIGLGVVALILMVLLMRRPPPPPVLEPVERTSTLLCPSCGGEVDPGAQFCNHCGGTLAEDDITRVITPVGNLHFDSGPVSFEAVPVKRGMLPIGRDSAKNKSGLALDQSDVSSTHAVIETNGDVATLRDLNSTNGTYVNGNRIGEHVLQPGDKIKIGGTTFVYKKP